MEALANTKRITFANKLGKPKVYQETKVEAALVPQTIGFGFQVYRTYVKVFIQSTGDDSGSMVELRGFIKFLVPPQSPAGDQKDIGNDQPILKNWTDLNGGFGLLQGEHFRDSAFFPTGFQAVLYEDDTFGRDVILDYTIDWNNPANLIYADGREWSISSSNSSDNRYVANLTWQVTQL